MVGREATISINEMKEVQNMLVENNTKINQLLAMVLTLVGEVYSLKITAYSFQLQFLSPSTHPPQQQQHQHKSNNDINNTNINSNNNHNVDNINQGPPSLVNTNSQSK